MQVFEVLADPIRREILDLLAERERPAGELGAAFDVSRPAVSRHLRVLREAGLVRWRGEAQRRIYSLSPEPLAEVDEWLSRYRRYWAGRLDALERLVTEDEGEGERDDR
jgi:DNA-binding transcriptional ArsR family regulator